jgi:hypothetical protein
MQAQFVASAEAPRVGHKRNPVAHFLPNGQSLENPACQERGTRLAGGFIDCPQTRPEVSRCRNLSQPNHAMEQDDDVAVPMRDGINLLVDVHRPTEPGRYPVLVAASPYPRQIQNLGAPAGFIEAGASDFFVPRGYVHVIANCRGTGGSGGTFGFFDGQERRDIRPRRVGRAATLVGRQCRHDRDKLFRGNADGGGCRTAGAP